MFGADTPLMMDALQIAALAAAVGAGAVVLTMRRKKRSASADVEPRSDRQQPDPSTLEQRVRVLERIATDRATDRPAERSAELAEEIESLRDSHKGVQLETATQFEGNS
jgi:hypothetical protein